jgi:hypothetical protein
VVQATSAAGAVVTYQVSFYDIADPGAALFCHPASGSTFPSGSTWVQCTAEDNSRNVTSNAFQVTVTPANLAPTASWKWQVANDTLTLDATASSDDGSIVSYEWYGPDGTVFATGPTVNKPLKPNVVFSQSVGLRVTDDQGLTHSVTQAISFQAPAAVFTWKVESSTLKFDGTGSFAAAGTIVRMEWVGPDGTLVATGPTAATPLPAGVSFTGDVTLRIKDDRGMIGMTTQTVAVAAPVARFEWRIEGGQLILDASSSSDDGTIVRYEWKNATGAFVVGPAVLTATLPAGATGSKDFTLRVTDEGGLTSTVTHTVTLGRD